MVVVTACVAQRAGGVSCLISYSSLLLPDPAPVLDKSQCIMVFATMLVVFNFIGLALVDKVGRKPLLIISEVGLALITAVFGLYFYLASREGGAASLSWVPYACHFSFSLLYSIGIGFIPVVYLGEMFPVNIRSHCSAIVSITLAFSSFVSNKVFPYMSREYGIHTMFWGFTGVNVACAYIAYRYAIETTGKTFLEIQELLEEDDTPPKKLKERRLSGGRHQLEHL